MLSISVSHLVKTQIKGILSSLVNTFKSINVKTRVAIIIQLVKALINAKITEISNKTSPNPTYLSYSSLQNLYKTIVKIKPI